MASPDLSLVERRARLSSLAPSIVPTTTAGNHLLPVSPALASLFPRDGLQRGTVVSVAGSGGALSLAFAVGAASSADGNWLAVMGTERLGLAAVAELGVSLDRLVMVDAPEPGQWGTVAAALVDAFDMVLVATRHRIDAGAARRLGAKARERGSVILQVGRWGWPEAPDVRLDVIECQWAGLGQGHGVLRSRQITVTAVNRRDARPRRKSALWLPGVDGTVCEVIASAPADADEPIDAEIAASAPPLADAG